MNSKDTLTHQPAPCGLIASERVWPYLVIGDETVIDALRQKGHVSRALAHGRQEAASIRRSHPDQGARAVLSILDVEIVESDEDPKIAWRYRRSEYSRRPPRVTIYRKALPEIAGLAAEAGLGAVFPEKVVGELALAHELYHHIALTTSGRVSNHCRIAWIELGPLKLRRRIPALDEVAAQAFAQAFVGASLPPTVLDWLTVYRDPERFEACVRRAERLVELHRL